MIAVQEMTSLLTSSQGLANQLTGAAALAPKLSVPEMEKLASSVSLPDVKSLTALQPPQVNNLLSRASAAPGQVTTTMSSNLNVMSSFEGTPGEKIQKYRQFAGTQSNVISRPFQATQPDFVKTAESFRPSLEAAAPQLQNQLQAAQPQLLSVANQLQGQASSAIGQVQGATPQLQTVTGSVQSVASGFAVQARSIVGKLPLP